MKTIETFFLRGKHWQLFLLAVAGPSYVFSGRRYLIPLAALAMISYLTWIWVTGSFLGAISNPPNTLGNRLFRVAIVYLTLWLALPVTIFHAGLFGNFTAIRIPVFAFTLLFLSLFFIAILCFPFALYFWCKHLLLAELRDSADFSEYLELIFLLGFFFVGVWNLQPRINRLYSRRIQSKAID
jgi:hypothetical protein